jgi:hypothetical protein
MDARSRRTMPTKDHDIPLSRGGGNGANVVWACYECNHVKGSMTGAEYREWLNRGRPNKREYLLSLGLTENDVTDAAMPTIKQRQWWLLEWLRSRGNKIDYGRATHAERTNRQSQERRKAERLPC